MPRSPLDSQELRAIHDALERGDTAQAAARLSEVDTAKLNHEAVDYLTARLLYVRGLIEQDELIARLRHVATHSPEFMEATAFLAREERSRPLRTSQPAPVSAPPPVFDALGNKQALPLKAGRYRSSIPAPRPSSVPPPPRPPSASRDGLAVDTLIDTRAYAKALRVARETAQRLPHLGSAHFDLAWANVRRAIAGDANALDEARSALEHAHASERSGVPVEALSAYLEARGGDARVAVQLAQRVLRLLPRQVEALAALAEASALLGHESKAIAALERLEDIDRDLARSVSARLRSLGLGEPNPSSSASLWHALENTLASGASEAALQGLMELADDQLEAVLGGRGSRNPEYLALCASRFLTRAPVFRQFGSFDFSLSSIQRLDAALDLICGSGPRATSEPAPALFELCASYLGDTLRQCLSGSWHTGETGRQSVLTKQRPMDPLQLIMGRVAHGRRGRLPLALAPVLASATDEAYLHALRDSIAPAPLWGDQLWPSIAELPRIARALSHSVVDLYTQSAHGIALDRSLDSLSGLDRYLLLVRGTDGLSAESAWARWVTSLAGAYFGEVLVRHGSGRWECAVDDPALADLQVVTARGVCRPLSSVSGILCGNDGSLAKEASALLDEQQ